MTRRVHRRLAAWLGLFAMLLALAGPLYAQWRALDSLALAQSIDLSVLHCGEGYGLPESGAPAWVKGLSQCGYCDLLGNSPPLPSALPPALLPPPGRFFAQAPPAVVPLTALVTLPQPRGPPVFQA